MKLLLKILAGLAILIVLLGGGVYATSSHVLAKRFSITDTAPATPSDAASLERGRHIARAITKCAGCHGDDLGGELMIDAMPFARVASMNLTKGKGGRGATLSDAQIVTAIRHGVGGDGRALFLMPSTYYNSLSDEDVAAIVAYVRSMPPVDREQPAAALGPVGRTLLVTGKLKGIQEAYDIDHSAKRVSAPPAGPTVEYGAYLVTVGACKACHGPTLAGGPRPNGPPGLPAANITPEGLKAYDEAAFFHALREGKRPSGAPIDTLMPWRLTREMTDDEIRAVWKYLQTVPARAFGAR